MANYDFFKPFIYRDLDEADLDENNQEGHSFFPLKDSAFEYITKAEKLLGITLPSSLLQLYKEVGVGQLYTNNRDDYRYRYSLLHPYEIVALYFEDYDEDFQFGGSRTDIMEILKDGRKLCFMEASEHDFFQIHIDEGSIWIFGRKIADSLEEFLYTQLTSPIKN